MPLKNLDLPHACRTRLISILRRARGCLKCSLAFCAALVCDVRASTSFSEKVEPHDFSRALSKINSIGEEALPRLLRALIGDFMLYEGVVLFIALAFEQARQLS